MSDITTSQDTENVEKPSWANWIENESHPHLVVGIECRECKANVTGLKPNPAVTYPYVWRKIEHAPDCNHSRILDEQPDWAEWIDDDDAQHLAVGISCTECGEEAYGSDAKRTVEHDGIWRFVAHTDKCEHNQDYRYPELPISDLFHLAHQYELHGRSRVVRWLRGNVALPTRLELKQMNGEEVDEEAFYQSAADHYLDIK